MPEPKFEEKQRILQMSEISLILDTYDDIFSDFDPRPYSERTISDDFLYATKKASISKPSGVIALKLLIPTTQRNSESEKLIKKRLHEHFRHRLRLLLDEAMQIRRKGGLLAVCGLVIMLAAAGVSMSGFNELLKNILMVLFEPAGWFMAWFGFEQIFYGANENKQDIQFYKKMSKCEIRFKTY